MLTQLMAHTSSHCSEVRLSSLTCGSLGGRSFSDTPASIRNACTSARVLRVSSISAMMEVMSAVGSEVKGGSAGGISAPAGKGEGREGREGEGRGGEGGEGEEEGADYKHMWLGVNILAERADCGRDGMLLPLAGL